MSGSPPAPAHLTTLPFELLELIISHIPHARSLASLLLTCKCLYHFITTHGWPLFVREHFPVQALQVKSRAKAKQLHGHHESVEFDWAQTANHLTSLSRSWESQDFRLRFLTPPFAWGGDELYLFTVDPVLDCWEELGCGTSSGSLRDDRLVVGVRNTILVRRRRGLGRGMETLVDWGVYPKIEPVAEGTGHPEIGYLRVLAVDSRVGGDGGGDDDEGFNGEMVFVYQRLGALETVELQEASHEAFYEDRFGGKTIGDEVEKTARGYKQLFRYDTGKKVPYGADASPDHNVVAAALRGKNKQELALYPLYAKVQERSSPRDSAITHNEAKNDSHQPISIPISSRIDRPLQKNLFTRELKFVSKDRFIIVNYCPSYYNLAGPTLSVWQITPDKGLREAPIWEPHSPEAAAADIEPFCAVKVPDGSQRRP